MPEPGTSGLEKTAPSGELEFVLIFYCFSSLKQTKILAHQGEHLFVDQMYQAQPQEGDEALKYGF